MFENPRRGRQARNFTTNVPKILDLESSSEQIRNLTSGAPDYRRLTVINSRCYGLLLIRIQTRGPYSVHYKGSSVIVLVFRSS